MDHQASPNMLIQVSGCGHHRNTAVILVNDKVGPGGGALMARGGIFKKQADNMI